MFFLWENIGFRMTLGMTDYAEWGAHLRRNGAQGRVFPSVVPKLHQNHLVRLGLGPRSLSFIVSEGVAIHIVKGTNLKCII